MLTALPRGRDRATAVIYNAVVIYLYAGSGASVRGAAAVIVPHDIWCLPFQAQGRGRATVVGLYTQTFAPPLEVLFPNANKSCLGPIFSYIRSHSSEWPNLGSENVGIPPIVAPVKRTTISNICILLWRILQTNRVRKQI